MLSLGRRFVAKLPAIANDKRHRRAVIENGAFTDEEFKAQLGVEKANLSPCGGGYTKEWRNNQLLRNRNGVGLFLRLWLTRLTEFLTALFSRCLTNLFGSSPS
jgi:hypothetical protein